MKIAFLGIKGLPSKGGAERVVEAIVRRLAEQYELTVYCSQHYTAPEARIPGVKLIRMPCFRGKYTHMTSFDILAAWHAVFRGDYDLIHLHTIEASFTLPILRVKYKVVTTAHGRHVISPAMRFKHVPEKWGPISMALMNLMEIPYAALSSALTSVSQNYADELSKRYNKRVRYIPNGVDREPDINLEAARAVLAEYKIEAGSYFIFAAGRRMASKGGHLLIKALESFSPHYRLVMIGDQAARENQKDRFNLNSDRRVIFLPFITDKATLLGLLKLSHLFIFPSIREAMSMMLLEAASVGVPILCSDIPGNTAVLPEQALYFCSQDVQDLREKLEWAMGHEEEMSKLGKKAQEHVQKNFSWDEIVKQYEQLYGEVCGVG